MTAFGAIDLGGTAIKAATVDADGRILARRQLATDVQEGREAVVERICTALRAASSGAEIAAVGVGVPGLVDDDGAIIRFPNFPGWDGFGLGDLLRRRLAIPVVIENDANAAAVAEGFVGAARGCADYLFVTLGTGVGGGLVLDGRLHRGVHSRAAELGHVKVVPDGRPCGCGARGCVESYASGPALVAAARDGGLRPPGDDELTPLWLYERARGGDLAARALFEDAARHLGTALSAVVNLLDVTAFFLGGGVSGAFDLLAPTLRRTVVQEAFGLPAADLRIEPALCGNDAGLIGCARLASLAPGAGC